MKPFYILKWENINKGSDGSVFRVQTKLCVNNLWYSGGDFEGNNKPMHNGAVVVLTIASMIILSAMTILGIKEWKRRQLQDMDHFLFIDQEKIFPIRLKEI